jgi:glycosyltransferase involved in cell wall biosynthesis
VARLLFHVPSLGGGGAERVWVLVANEMARRGHQTTLLVWNGEGPNAVHRAANVELVDFGMPVRNESFGKPATLQGLWRMARFIAGHRPDAVFSAPEFANLMAASALLLAPGKARFFPSFHAAASLRAERVGSRLAQMLAGVVASRATRLIAVSQGIAGDLAASGRVDTGKLVVIHNPLPPPAPDQPPVFAWQQGLAEARASGVPVIVTAGRLVEVKDHRSLIEAFAVLRRPRPAKLVIFGEGPLRGALESLVAERGLGDDVLMPGFVADTTACYTQADLFVLTSKSEGFGNVLVEAMNAGVPVVSTDCPHGPREILDHGAFGTLVPVGDVPALVAAMNAALDAPAPAEKLKHRAADFSITRIGDQYEALLD